MTAGIETSASFLGTGGKVNLDVTGSYGQTVTTTVSQSVELELRLDTTEYYDRPGSIWQWEVDLTDTCGNVLNVDTKFTVITDFADEKPCCLPGLFKYPEHTHGPCRDSSPCVCEPDVCSGEALQKKLEEEILRDIKEDELEDAVEEQYEREQEQLKLVKAASKCYRRTAFN